MLAESCTPLAGQHGPEDRYRYEPHKERPAIELEADQCHLIMYFLKLSASTEVSFQHIFHIKLLMSH